MDVITILPHDVCSCRQSFDHDVNSYPYYDVSDEAYARLNALMEAMYERHEHFISDMREFDLLYETNPSIPFIRLEASLYDNSESSFALESNVVDDVPLIDLEEAFNPPSISLPFVTPSFSCTPMDSSVSDLTLLTSLLPFAQCTGLEIGEIFSGDASAIEDASLVWSKEPILVEPCREEAPFKEL